LQCVAVCCSVLQCVAVCCRIMQCVAVRNTCQHRHPRPSATCCRVLQCDTQWWSVLQRILCIWITTRDHFQCVAMRCNEMQCDAMWWSMLQCFAVCIICQSASPFEIIYDLFRIEHIRLSDFVSLYAYVIHTVSLNRTFFHQMIPVATSFVK